MFWIIWLLSHLSRLSPRRRRASPAGRAPAPPLMWRRWNIRAQKKWEAGVWESAARESGCPWGIGHSDLPLPQAGGSLRSHLPFLWLGAKEVVLQRLKRLCHMIQWAIVGKGAQGAEHTIKTAAGEVCAHRCVHCVRESRGGREVVHEGGNRLAGKNDSMSVCKKRAMGKKSECETLARRCLPWHLPEVLLHWPFHLVFN